MLNISKVTPNQHSLDKIFIIYKKFYVYTTLCQFWPLTDFFRIKYRDVIVADRLSYIILYHNVRNLQSFKKFATFIYIASKLCEIISIDITHILSKFHDDLESGKETG